MLSIASSKVLLSPSSSPPSSSRGRRPVCSPLVLKAQQLAIGAALLRAVIESRRGRRRRRACAATTSYPPGLGDGSGQEDDHDKCEAGSSPEKWKSSPSSLSDGCDAAEERLVSSPSPSSPSTSSAAQNKRLFLTAMHFALGFLFTNFGFEMGSTAFVETIKAAEPFTSAYVAAIWGIERPGRMEVLSLMGILGGVVLSTLGHRGEEAGGGGDLGSVVGGAAKVRQSPSYRSSSSSSSSSLPTVCLIVMAVNLCFSFRGLYQKLFRSTPSGAWRTSTISPCSAGCSTSER